MMNQRSPSLRLADFINPQSIALGLDAVDKPGVIRELTGLLFQGRPELNRVLNPAEVYNLLMEREQLAATGIGNAIAVPHASSAKIKQIVGGFALSEVGVAFGALDRLPCQFFFVLLSPTSQPKIHIKALSRISRLLTVETTRQALKTASTVQDVFDALMAGDEYLEALKSKQEPP